MAADGRIYDGHKAIFGQDTDTDPSYLRAEIAAKAINRAFRGGKNTTRSAFKHRTIVFDSNDDKLLFECGNIQGWFCYRKKLYGRKDCVVVSVAGCVFALVPSDVNFVAKKIIEGLDAGVRFVWFEQAEEWLYVSNGKDLPFRWNGSFQSPAEQSMGKANGQMPVGTIMKYAHGRVFISDENDHTLASDIVYGNGFTNTANTWNFTENEYWAEGGYFGMPANLGSLTGMLVMQRMSRDLRGQGELLITGDLGSQQLEVSLPRSTWKDAQIQAVTMHGRGCVAFSTLINVNNDAFFRSSDGLSSYAISRKEAGASWSLSKISRDVNYWMDQDTPAYLNFASSIYFDNRILTTVSPMVSIGQRLTMSDSSYLECGSHFYHRGILSLDLDKASNVSGDADFNWDGLWTGARPCGMVTGFFDTAQRGFILSYDPDGINRIYEIDKFGINDELNGEKKKIKWSYTTKRFNWENTQKSNSFEVKKIIGGNLRVSDIRDIVKIKAEYRADDHPQWRTLLPEKTLGLETGINWEFSQPKYAPINFPSPKDECNAGSKIPANRGAEFQIKVSGEGHVKVDRLRIAMPLQNDPNSPQSDCDDGDTILIDSTPDNDYDYSIV